MNQHWNDEHKANTHMRFVVMHALLFLESPVGMEEGESADASNKVPEV